MRTVPMLYAHGMSHAIAARVLVRYTRAFILMQTYGALSAAAEARDPAAWRAFRTSTYTCMHAHMFSPHP